MSNEYLLLTCYSFTARCLPLLLHNIFHSFRRASTSFEELQGAAQFIGECITAGRGVYIHCANGVGRAPTTAAAYLISTGLSAEEAWSKIRQARPFIRPTKAQREMIDRLAAQTKVG